MAHKDRVLEKWRLGEEEVARGGRRGGGGSRGMGKVNDSAGGIRAAANSAVRKSQIEIH